MQIIHLKPNSGDIETWIALEEGSVIGHIYMKIESGKKIKFLDAWVDENWRRKGVWRSLWDCRWDYVNKNYSGYLVYAWCKEGSLPLLVEKGFSVGETCYYVEKEI